MPELKVIKRSGEEVVIEATAGHSVMEAISASGAEDIAAICGGACACATCHVFLGDEFLDRTGAASEPEKELLDFSDNARPQSRLSCQIIMTDELSGLCVEVAPEEM